MALRYLRMIERVSENPETPVAGIDMLCDMERVQILEGFNHRRQVF